VTRARTQKPRARTSAGEKKRPATAVPFDQLEAAIDALDADDREAASAEAEERSKPARRGPPGPPPPKRTAPPRPAPSRVPIPAPRPAVDPVATGPAPATSRGPALGPAPAPAASRGPAPAPRPPTTRAPEPAAPPTRRGPPRPPPGAPPPPESTPEPIHHSDSSARIRRRLDSDDFSSGAVRAISVGDVVEDDLVVETDDVPELRTLAIAIHDDPPQLTSAKGAIAVVGHRVAAAASGSIGIEQIKSLLRSGSADVLMVGVPGGEVLIDTALALAPRRPVVIAACTGTSIEAVRKAGTVGADLAIARPIEPERLAPILLAAARLVDERHNALAARGSETMLRARLDALVEPEPGALQPFELFQRVLELELKRSRRYGYPIAVALFSVAIPPPEPPPGVRGILRARAGNALIHAIRDIDMATEVDQERFLVLLPYTSLAGAAEVARRIIGAVTKGDPVVASGQSFPPRIVGAVAGAVAGEPLSFSRLMRDATQALEQARRDGAELAVPIVRDDR